MANTTSFRLLGTMEVLVGGRAVDVGRRRERGLLAVLLLHVGTAVSVDRLVDLLWDGSPSDNARQNLYSHVSRLRRQIPGAAEWILARDGGYVAQLDPSTVDAHLFRTLVGVGRHSADPVEQSRVLREALGLWRGPILDDLTPDRLRDRIAGDLPELRLVATEIAVDAELTTGRHQDLVGELAVLIAEYPLRERLVGQLMLALSRSGRSAEAVAVYHQLRTRLADELGLHPSAELQERYLTVVRQESVPGVARTARGRSVPSQLPMVTSHFTGRAELLAELDGTTVAVVRGMAGVGKTALAVHWAHQVTDRFPDGQLFVDLGGHSVGGPRSPGEVLAHFLDVLGVRPERRPEGVPELAALYRTTLNARKVLVVLDNASSADQVRPLISGGSGCSTVVTSRDDLAGLTATHDARPLTVDVLPPADATSLLHDILGPGHDTGTDELVRLCGFLPLALRIAAAQITSLGRSPGDLVAALADSRLDVLGIPGDPQVAVRAALRLSVDVLDPAARRLFGTLALAPGRDFTDHVAGALLDVPAEQAAATLATLVSAHLVQLQPSNRYRMHDLVRAYAEELCAGDLAATERVVTWYLHTAGNTDLALTPFRPRPGGNGEPSRTCPPLRFSQHAEALAWFMAEEANLVAAVRTAAEHGLHGVAWRIPVSLSYFTWVHKGHVDLVECLLIGRASAEQDGDAEGLAWMSFGMGVALEQRRQFDDAITEYQDAVVRYLDAGLPWAAGCALTNIGNSHRDAGRFHDAFEHYRQSAKLFVECGMRWGVGLNLYGEGNAHRLMGQYGLALECFRGAAEISTEMGFHWGVAVNLVCIGDTWRLLGKPAEALEHYLRALTAARSSGDEAGEGDVLDLCAQTEHDLGRTTDAVKHWTAALALYERLDHARAPEIRARLAAVQATG